MSIHTFSKSDNKSPKIPKETNGTKKNQKYKSRKKSTKPEKSTNKYQTETIGTERKPKYQKSFVLDISGIGQKKEEKHEVNLFNVEEETGQCVLMLLLSSGCPPQPVNQSEPIPGGVWQTL